MIRELFAYFLHFISLVATIRECITASWSVVLKQFECSIVTKILQEIASRETIRLLTLRYLMISKIQRSWRQFCDVTITGSFQMGLETNCRARISFRRPFIPNSFFASMLPWRAGLVGGAKTELAPGRGETPGTPLVAATWTCLLFWRWSGSIDNNQILIASVFL